MLPQKAPSGYYSWKVPSSSYNRKVLNGIVGIVEVGFVVDLNVMELME